ncbi:hypothetical protein [Streptomyces sp. AC558_RSS880]|uniref:hypothetical protein n=1 Tax=Streptomyces sp. AC558_RSS880 TaxID=2823687 RepID=UPI001C21EABA|nr:hypothetical protein [Streptomyces sp. AC558_RSS880]
MLLLVLAGVLVLAVGGCACVVRAARGGPRWARGVAKATLPAGEPLRSGRSNGRAGSGDD